MGQALYRKYRSKSLDEIVGQSHITDMLKRAIASDNIAHAYLLTGPRGVGKTSIARILAHEINQLPYADETNHLDIIEIDAASNNSVDDVRDLREKVMVALSSARKKVYIIDEVHMLSKQAFNALLKTLEEPPEHIVFILATTDANKLPATIISRVQRFNFRAIQPDTAAKHLRKIADAENIMISDEALELIAHQGKGSFRDSISLLDQLRNISDKEITASLIEKVLGLAETDIIERLIEAYKLQDIHTIVQLLDTAESQGAPALTLVEQLIYVIRNRVTAEPELISLLDNLLDVARSAWPHVKLLTALTNYPKSSSVAQPAKPSLNTDLAANKQSDKVAEQKPVSNKDQTGTQKETLDTSDSTASAQSDESKAPGTGQPFSWEDFVSALSSHTGAHSIIKNCKYNFDDNKLTIYAGKKFYKNKLDAALPALAEALQSIGVINADISILESSAPPKDSQVAAVFDIMGGGEEVEL